MIDYNKRTARVNRKRLKIERVFGFIMTLLDLSRQMFKIARRAFPTAFKIKGSYNKITFKNWR